MSQRVVIGVTVVGWVVVFVIIWFLSGCATVYAIREPTTDDGDSVARVTDSECGDMETHRDMLTVAAAAASGLGAGVPPIIAVVPSTAGPVPAIILTSVGVTLGVAGIALGAGAMVQSNAITRSCTSATRSTTP